MTTQLLIFLFLLNYLRISTVFSSDHMKNQYKDIFSSDNFNYIYHYNILIKYVNEQEINQDRNTPTRRSWTIGGVGSKYKLIKSEYTEIGESSRRNKAGICINKIETAFLTGSVILATTGAYIRSTLSELGFYDRFSAAYGIIRCDSKITED